MNAATVFEASPYLRRPLRALPDVLADAKASGRFMAYDEETRHLLEEAAGAAAERRRKGFDL